jgi:hypothetical protein
MTNRERLKSLLGFAPPTESLDGALIDAAIDGTLTYDLSYKGPVRKAAIYLLEMLLSTPDTGNSEPSFNIRYDRVAVEKRLLMLKEEDGIIDETGPTIRGLSIW